MEISKKRKNWSGEIESSIEIFPETERFYDDYNEGYLIETGITISIVDFESDCEGYQKDASISLSLQEEDVLRNYLNEREEQRRALLG